ncbi:hypothetical protein GPECTOR_5g379 [Gonium pectorale]|uniref:Uncharacterized protein n=1 Tax=Gonium pectorale TaxID=33097 RepID=A0A150GX82_GONPE|nr:hypothetical protein GPECTOR_5g379 [Gonium pectorale]|eukprot:KXZ54292.1 hypothetical protein GPECTOR_5g379 [Gonium pectorale]
MQETENLVAEAEQVLARCRALSSRALTYCNRIVGESDALAVEIKSLLQTISSAEKQARGLTDRTQAEAVRAVLRDAREAVTGLGPGGDLRKFCKPRNPWLVRLLLGDRINLVALRRDVSQGIREEYHAFRDTSAAVMLLGPLALVLGMSWADRHQGGALRDRHTDAMAADGWGAGAWGRVQLYLMWLSYFYLAMALRENVLYVNGSRIRSWWMQHHYWSAGASLAMLGLPITSPAVHLFLRSFLVWSVFQAAVMFVQNRYQRRRMYTRIALGRNSAMDVVAGESSGAAGQLVLLYPLLFTLQARLGWVGAGAAGQLAESRTVCQAAVRELTTSSIPVLLAPYGAQVVQFAIGAGVAWRTYPAILSTEGWLENEAQGSDLRGMRGVFFVGLTFAYMAYRNFVTTLLTMLEKRSGAGRKAAAAERPRGPSRGPSARGGMGGAAAGAGAGAAETAAATGKGAPGAGEGASTAAGGPRRRAA